MQPAPDSDQDIEVESVPDEDTAPTPTLEQDDSLIEKPVTKTKIFRPDQEMLKNVDEIVTHLPDHRNNSLFQNDTTVRRSAFTVPAKTNRDNVTCKTKITKGVPLLEDRQAIIRGRKRSFPFVPHEREAFAYCCCGSHNCKVKVIDYSSEDSETESMYSYGSVSPNDFQTTNIYPADRKLYFEQNFEQNEQLPSSGEFVLRRESQEYRGREENEILQLQQNLGLNKKVDPFMGCDYSDPFVCDSFDELLSDGGLYRSNSQLC